MKICVFTPTQDSYSETFISAHIHKLPAEVRVIYGDGRRTRYYRDDGQPLLKPAGLPGRIANSIWNRVFRLTQEHHIREAMKRFLLENDVRAVLAEYGPTGTRIMRICQSLGIPLAVHFHGFDAYEHRILEFHKEDYWVLFDIAAAIIVVSRDMQNQLLKLGAPAMKIHCNPCGVDPALFSRASPASAPPVFLAAGRLVDKKAPYLSLLAFRRVLDAHPEARLRVIGDGMLKETCLQLTEALAMSENVEFWGARPHHEVASAMQSARAFVQHSVVTHYGDSEGTPVSVLEAGASGLPVVSTRHAGIQDAVIHNETGFLVDERDIEGMAGYMSDLLQNPPLAASMGERAREHILAYYSMDKSISNLWSVIEAVAIKK
ncbi:MAG: glycosyltransferase [Armatimonadetes bacterium]|nr:glycosyltransferase [Armatimonadota bacterium]